MKKCLIIIVIFCFCSFESYSRACISTNIEVIATFKDKIDYNAIKSARGKIARKYKNLPMVAIDIPSCELQDFSNNKSIKSIEENTKVTANTVQNNLFKNKCELLNIFNIFGGNSIYTGKDIKISVVDTGISVDHPDLIVKGGVSFVSYTNSYDDDNGHGTQVAGVIGALDNGVGTTGTAPDSNLYAVKVLDNYRTGKISDMVAGIDWCITNKMDIINLSIALPNNSPSLEKIINKAYNQGALIVSSVGNYGTENANDDNIEYPAKYESVISVSSVDSDYKRAIFSSTGSANEIAAPGISLLTTNIKKSYIRSTGTSLSAAYVSGILALYKQQNKSFTNKAIREELIRNAIDLGEKGRDSSTGYGLVQSPNDILGLSLQNYLIKLPFKIYELTQLEF